MNAPCVLALLGSQPPRTSRGSEANHLITPQPRAVGGLPAVDRRRTI